MRYYAIADLHGRHDLLNKALDAITKHADKDRDIKIITLGDYIDRGPDSNRVIQTLMDFQSFDGVEMICLQGNHEAMAVESISSLPDINWWVGNGGDATIHSYGYDTEGNNWDLGEVYQIRMPQGVIPDEHVKWMASLPIYFETEKQLFVHAGVPQSEMNLPPKHAHHLQDMQWMLYDKRTAGGWKGKHVVHGHHQFEDGPHVWHGPRGGRTNLDVYAWQTGRIVVGVFDDTQGPALEFLEVKDG